jgi:hypothetical protein
MYALSSYAGMTTSNTSSHDLPAVNAYLFPAITSKLRCFASSRT